MEEEWTAFHDHVHFTAFKHLKAKRCKYNDTFDENDSEVKAIMYERYKLLRPYLNDTSFRTKKTARRKMSANLRNYYTKIPCSARRGMRLKFTLIETTSSLQ